MTFFFFPVFQLMIIIGLAHALVVFRVVAAALLSEGNWEFVRDHASSVAMLLGAVLHYITIQVMTRVRFYNTVGIGSIRIYQDSSWRFIVLVRLITGYT